MTTIAARILGALRATNGDSQHTAAELKRQRAPLAERIAQATVARSRCVDDTSPRYRLAQQLLAALDRQDRALAFRLRLIEAEDAVQAARKAAAADVEAKLAEHQAQQQAQTKAATEGERLQQRLAAVARRIEAAEAAARGRVATAKEALLQASAAADGEPDEALADGLRAALRGERQDLEDLQPLRVQAEALAAELQARQAAAAAAQAAGEAALKALQAARAEVAAVEVDAAALALHRADVHAALAGAGARLLLVGRWDGMSHHLRRLLGVPRGHHLLLGELAHLERFTFECIADPDPDNVLDVDPATVPDVSMYAKTSPFVPASGDRMEAPPQPLQVPAVAGR